MCLTTKNPKIQVAEKDIYVYKECTGVTKEKCYPEWFLRTTYIAGEQNEKVALSTRVNLDGNYEVEKGYHSYNTPKSGTNTLFKIPKGTQYISGWYNNNPLKRNRVSATIEYVGPLFL